QGVWQYSTDDGENWTAITAGTYLANDVDIRFLPKDNWNGTPGQLIVHLVENDLNTDSTGNQDWVTGNTYSTADKDIGGTTRVSKDTVAIGTVVTPVNDAPEFKTLEVSITQPEDSTAKLGANNSYAKTISALVSNAMFKDDTDQVSGGSTKDSFWGIAIVGGVEDAHGKWMYSVDGGATWAELKGAYAAAQADDGKALALSKDVKLRFDSEKDWNSYETSTEQKVTSLQFRLIESESTKYEREHDTPDIVPANPSGAARVQHVDVSEGKTGGITHISEAIGKLTLTVTQANDAPTGSSDYDFGRIAEDTLDADLPKHKVSEMVSANFKDGSADPNDGDAWMNQADSFGGIIITSNAATAAQGVWQYSTNGTSWNTISTGVSETNGLVLDANAWVRFKPAKDFNGEPGQLKGYIYETDADNETGTKSTWTTGKTGVNVDATHRGENLVPNKTTNETRVSNEQSTFKIYVTPVEDYPEFLDIATFKTIEDWDATSFVINDIVSKVFDNSRDKPGTEGTGSVPKVFWGIAVTDLKSEHGTWEYSADGTNWTELKAEDLADTNLVLRKEVQLRYEPNDDYFG
ncbi:MAG: hypothetical protein HUK26_07630, partial [Duodenibacillus sp.]|nr:hypothetical protein [Duodenibacillus sp.]